MTRLQVPAIVKSSEEVLIEAFQRLGCARLGGASVNGWSRVSDYLRCHYRYYLKHIRGVRASMVAATSRPQDIGSFIHAILAVHYAAMLPDDRYPGFRANCPTPDQLIETLNACGAEPEALAEAGRLWDGYLDHWGEDGWQPMAVEMAVGDPDLHTSRYDLVVDITDGIHDGFWIGEHKSASPQTDLELFRFDGEILGECMSWRISKLDEMFGPLSGVCVNVLVKGGRKPQRLWIPVNWSIIEDFIRSRMYWQAEINMMTKHNRWPKSHYGCVARYDRCCFWDHCSTLSDSFLMSAG